MAAPSYTHDLQIFDDASDPNAAGWDEFTGMTVGAPPDADTDLAIYGAQCISADRAKTGLNSFGYDGTAVTVNTGEAFFIWMKWFAPNSLSTRALGGQQVVVGSSLTTWDAWYMDGSDTYAYGGWVNYAVDPTFPTDNNNGTVTTYNACGGAWNCPTQAPSKGNPMTIDIIRYGRGYFWMTEGDAANGYATFSGSAVVNDNPTTGRLGLIQAEGAGYLYKGVLSFGSASTAVDFRDSNTALTIDDTLKVSRDFNKIEVHVATSNVEWDNISVTSLGTQSPGSFNVVDNATVLLDGCTFSGMDWFYFQANTTVNSIFNNCGQIEASGSDLRNSTIVSYASASNTAALVWNTGIDTDGLLDGMTFDTGSSIVDTHAIEFGLNSPTTIDLNNITFDGYGASNTQDNSTFYFKRTSGTVTVNLVGCSGNFTHRTDGATIQYVISPVTTKVTVSDITSGAFISGSRVLMIVSSSDSGWPFQESISLTSIGTIATASHTGHGLSTNDSVYVQGAVEHEYNGAFEITKIDDNSYAYTLPETTTSPATGTPISTLALINGDTDASGSISDIRSFSVDQIVVGRARKATGTPFYKSSPIVGTVDSETGLSLTVQLIRDQ